MKKVLILSASFGDGHNTAARNIRDALELISDDVKVEVLDLLELTYGGLYTFARHAHLKVVQFAPTLWHGLYNLLDKSSTVSRSLGGFSQLRDRLAKVLHEAQPDCVVSTYPLYAHVIEEIYRDHQKRPFGLVTVVTDSISVNSAWYRAPSDLFCVANQATAEVLLAAGVSSEKVKPLGFPVSPRFAEPEETELLPPSGSNPRHVLYIINCGRKKTGRVIDRLLEIPRLHLTLTVGRDVELKAKLVERTQHHGERVRVFGWTNEMPQLMRSCHLVIGKAGGATVQECIAARCPLIINQIIPGQEEGNARLIQELNLGVVAEKGKRVIEAVETAFEKGARQWHTWRGNLTQVSRPEASIRIAELILSECEGNEPRGTISLFSGKNRPILSAPAIQSGDTSARSMLLCDFHIHTNYSDGKLTAPEVIDFYGERGFDVICITDHLADPRRLIGKIPELCRLTLGQQQVPEYFSVLERERKRAWRKYGMLVMTGIEFNKDGYTKKTSAHLLGIDLKQPIKPSLDLVETVHAIHDQGGLAVASHPHILESEWGKNTLYLWENQEIFAPLLDAWEIANRNNIFNRVGLKGLPFVANSDFHKPKHIQSWKTLLLCEKDPEAIKECIRTNRNVAITLFRDGPSLSKLKAELLPLPDRECRPVEPAVAGSLAL